MRAENIGKRCGDHAGSIAQNAGFGTSDRAKVRHGDYSFKWTHFGMTDQSGMPCPPNAVSKPWPAEVRDGSISLSLTHLRFIKGLNIAKRFWAIPVMC